MVLRAQDRGPTIDVLRARFGGSGPTTGGEGLESRIARTPLRINEGRGGGAHGLEDGCFCVALPEKHDVDDNDGESDYKGEENNGDHDRR